MWLTSCSAICAAGSSFPSARPAHRACPHADLHLALLKVGCPGWQHAGRAGHRQEQPRRQRWWPHTSAVTPPPARAPATLYNKAMPAIPGANSSGRHVVCSEHRDDFDPLDFGQLAARSKFMTSPEYIAVEVDHARMSVTSLKDLLGGW